MSLRFSTETDVPRVNALRWEKLPHRFSFSPFPQRLYRIGDALKNHWFGESILIPIEPLKVPFAPHEIGFGVSEFRADGRCTADRQGNTLVRFAVATAFTGQRVLL